MRKGKAMAGCPHLSNESDREGYYTCSAPRLFGDEAHTHRRSSRRCSLVDAESCLVYQRARADALAVEVARLKEQVLEARDYPRRKS